MLFMFCSIYLFTLFLAINRVSSLNCYICAEGGLEEFGECKTSFPFNCDGYAKRYAPSGKIFCRTTRHKTFNGTYTVVKECIAESAHYATFPRKSEQLDEECDVLELNGFEVAYCICRNADLCNSAPIVDQFTEFENKNPELFDPIPASNEAANGDDIDAAGTGTGSSEKQSRKSTDSFLDSAEFVTRQNSNANEDSVEVPEKEPQRHRLPEQRRQSLELPLQWTNGPLRVEGPFVAPPAGEEHSQNREDIQRPPLDGPSAATPQFPFATEEGEEGSPEEEAFMNSPGLSSSGSSATPTARTTAGLKRPISTSSGQPGFGVTNIGSTEGTGTQLGLLPELQCLQCKEPGLPDSGSDCRIQVVVSCVDQSRQAAGIGRPLCLTRQSENGGHFTVEKVCTTERAILNEFGGRQAADLLNGAIRDESACLEMPSQGTSASYNELFKQQQRQEQRQQKGQRLCVCSSAQCNRPSLAEQVAYGRAVVTQPMPKIHFGRESMPSSTNSPSPSSSTSKLLVVNSPAIEAEALNCAICLDVDLKEPKADCQNARAQNCAQLLQNEKAFCLTRQTQNGKDSFIVEKSCVSKQQFYQQFPEELEKHSDKLVPLGCASTYDGYVNYCICDGQMCNRHSLAQQAETGKKSSSPPASSSPIPPQIGSHNSRERQELADKKEDRSGTTDKPSAFSTAHASGGGAWEPNDDAELIETAKATNKRPAPANLSPTSTPRWTTTPSPAGTSSTTTSSALRDRLEKWKVNSQPNASSSSSAKTAGHRPKDIFEQFDEEQQQQEQHESSASSSNWGMMGRMLPIAMATGLFWLISACI